MLDERSAHPGSPQATGRRTWAGRARRALAFGCSRRVQALEQQHVVTGRVTLSIPARSAVAHGDHSGSHGRHTPSASPVSRKGARCPCSLLPGCRPGSRLPLKSCCPTWITTGVLLNKITRIEGVSGCASSFVMRRVNRHDGVALGHLLVHLKCTPTGYSCLFARMKTRLAQPGVRHDAPVLITTELLGLTRRTALPLSK